MKELYIKEHFKNPKYGKLTSFSSVIFLCWLMYSGFTVAYKESVESLNKEVSDYKVFKSECLYSKGKIRHEEMFWVHNIYCSKKNGDEIIFYSNYESEGFINLFTDKLFFGIPEFIKS